MDTGSYGLTQNTVIGAGDSGVRIQGPVGVGHERVGHEAVLNRGNINAGSFVFELNNADDVTLSHLGVTGALDGINVSNGSSGFVLESSRIFENDSTGVFVVDAASSGAVIRDSVFYGDVTSGAFGDGSRNPKNQDYGIFARGLEIQVLRNVAYHVGGSLFANHHGVWIEGSAGVVVRDNLFRDNARGGLTVLAADFDVSGNVAHDNGLGANSGWGFDLSDTDGGTVLGRAHDNLAYGNTTGFFLDGAGRSDHNEAHDNVTGLQTNLFRGNGLVEQSTIWRNTTGMFIGATGTTVRDSHVYGNSGVGIFVFARDTLVSGNTVHDNAIGIQVSGVFGGTGGPTPGIRLVNNLAYDDAQAGVVLQDANPTPFSGPLQPIMLNNTVYEPFADAVQLTGGSFNIQLRDNILWAGGAGHYAINVANTAQGGFASDYNDLFATNGGQLGLWQVPFGTLADWRYELGFDTHSIFADPLFVRPAGADGVVGLQEFAGLRFEGFGNHGRARRQRRRSRHRHRADGRRAEAGPELHQHVGSLDRRGVPPRGRGLHLLHQVARASAPLRQRARRRRRLRDAVAAGAERHLRRHQTRMGTDPLRGLGPERRARAGSARVADAGRPRAPAAPRLRHAGGGSGRDRRVTPGPPLPAGHLHDRSGRRLPPRLDGGELPRRALARRRGPLAGHRRRRRGARGDREPGDGADRTAGV